MKIVDDLQKVSPYILTTIDGKPVFMNKCNPLYKKPKDNDRIVSVDCVMANEYRLLEITEELGLPPEHGVFELQP